MRNSCFEDNSFLVHAPIITVGLPPVTLLSTYGTANNPTALGCDFLSQFTTPQTLELGVALSCRASNSDTCRANLVTAPPSATLPPSPTPVVAPTVENITAAPVVAPISTPAPNAGPECFPFAVACTVSSDCCSNRCVFGTCQRPFVAASSRTKLSGGRGGIGGVTKLSRGGGGRDLLQKDNNNNNSNTDQHHRSKPRIRGR
jgi:hypothetical protein